MAVAAKKISVRTTPKGTPDSKKIVSEEVSNEFIFAIVGHVGSGNTTVATALEEVLKQHKMGSHSFEVAIIKARDVIEEGMQKIGTPMSASKGKFLAEVRKYQDAGDKLREKDHAAVARGAVSLIRRRRAEMQGTVAEPEIPVLPDGRPRAFIVDSIRHPAEVGLLRRIYGDAFVLAGVVCEQDERQRRLSKKYADAGASAAKSFMQRDAKASEKHGQRVSDAFHLSDFFVDNTAQRILDDNRTPNPDWKVTEDLERLIQLVTHSTIARPSTAESAMHAAAGAAMRSACLSRQVGAALIDAGGNVIATGTNEAPKAGGGVYSQGFAEETEVHDYRCAFSNKFCSNTQEQNEIAKDILIDLFGKEDEKVTDESKRAELIKKLRDGRIGDLLEFSRAVHAEMDALLSAGRKGASTVGSRLFVTTFPCHYCARHIVSAGVDEVQFIEPYPKSQALHLHRDSIQFEKGSKPWLRPSDKIGRHERKKAGDKTEPRVLFRPFTGVAPRMYGRAFQKDRELKNKVTGALQVQEPEWGTPYDLSRKSYAELEAALTKDTAE